MRYTNAQQKAQMAELVDALGLGSSVLGRAGSIPVLGIFLQYEAHSDVSFFCVYELTAFAVV